MKTICLNMAREEVRSLLGKILMVWMLFFAAASFAQAPAASGGAPPAISAAQIDKLVGPIALYPDDLIGIILPAATYPLDIVQADRFLDKRKADKNLPVNEAWHESIKSLLNYPDVVKKMSTDLDWTTALGEAVVADQGAVLASIQRFRRQVQAAGNLKSDEKQKVIVEKEVIQVVQANPEVIYVPQYNPSSIVVAGGYSSYGYYPAPYPVYYYPYPPGAAFASGLIWGAAITAAWNGGRYATHYGYGGGNNNINVNRNTSINTGNINTGNINRGSAQGTAWKSEKQPGQVSGGAGRTGNSARVGDAQRGGGGAGAIGGAGGFAGAGGGSNLAAGGARPSTQPAARPSSGFSDRSPSSAQAGDRGAQNRGGDAFGGYSSGGNARADSSRGAASRESMSSSGRGQSFQGGGGSGGRSSFGGGGGGGGGGRGAMGGGGGGGGGRGGGGRR